MSEPYFENISIDITEESMQLTYIDFTGPPLPGRKPLKSGFTIKKDENQPNEEFKQEGFKLLHEALTQIEKGCFKDKLKEKL